MEPFISSCIAILQNLHQQLVAALTGLPDEALDWVPGNDMNTIAVLASHTAGAERYLIGDIIGGDPSARDREAEFRQTGRSAAELIALLEATLQHSKKVLSDLKMDALAEMRPSAKHGRDFQVGWSLLHAIDHTATHLGHIQVTRQMWEQKRKGE